MQKLFNKLIALLLCVVTATASYQSVATETLSGAFSAITGGTSITSTDLSVMQSQTRTYVSGGSLQARFGTKDIQLISVEPPRFSAGCNGIDMHFGGFSFISGAEIQDMVKMIMKNAVGLVVDLAIKVLCPACADAMATIRNLAAAARAMAADSCSAAKAILGAVKKSLGTSSNGLCKAVPWNSAQTCDQQVPKDSEAEGSQMVSNGNGTGAFTDFLEGFQKMFEDAIGTKSSLIADKITDYDTRLADAGGRLAGANGGKALASESLDQLSMRGNVNDTLLLGLMGMRSYAQRMFLISMTGTELIQPDSEENIKKKGDPKNADPYWHKSVDSTVSPEQAVCLLKWGAGGPPPGIDARNDKCGDISKIQLLTCVSSPKVKGGGDWPDRTTLENGVITVGCMSMVPKPIAEWRTIIAQSTDSSVDPDPLLNFTAGIPTDAPASIIKYGDKVKAGGFYGMIQNSLLVAVERAGGKAAKATDEEKQVINIISTISPVPVYKIVGVAAVYPDVASGMIQSYSEVIASALAEGYIRHLMYEFRSLQVSGAELSQEQQAQAEHLRAMLKIIDASYSASGERFAQQQMLWQDLNMKLDGMQNLVRRQVGLQGSGGSTRFSQIVAPQ